MKSDTMTSEAAENKWLWSEKWSNFPWDILNYSKLWASNHQEESFCMVHQDLEKPWLPEQLPTKQVPSSSWLMVHKLCQKWPVRLKEIWEKPLKRLRKTAQRSFSSMKSIQSHQTEKKFMVKLSEELFHNFWLWWMVWRAEVMLL